MPPQLTDEQEQVKQRAMERFHAADETHRRYRERWDELDGLYHSTVNWRNGLGEARSRRSRIDVLRDGMKEFGAELFIPFSFTVVETVLPRMLSNRPKMLALPRNKASAPNADPVREILDAQQDKCNYEMVLQTTGKTALKLGLGVQKTGWRFESRKVQKLARRPVTKSVMGLSFPTRDFEWVPVVGNKVEWDDPYIADVSPYDFLWNPYGDSMDTVEDVTHRSWRSTRYVLDKVQSGEWAYLEGLTAEGLAAHSSKNRYSEIWANRRNIQGDTANFKGEIHEVLEVHDGEHVTVIVDREWPVAHFLNPHPAGRMPFHIYRPTEIEHQFCGKGEIEPIRDLQYEMNALRTDRRWNALLVLHKAFWYEDGAIDPSMVKISPGAMNPVNGPPSDMLKEIVVQDIPFSSYREEEAMKGDIDRTTGISDPAQGVGDAGQTATGVQLIQAAAGVRIQNKTRRMEVELIKPAAADFLALNQQRIRENRDVRVPMPPTPGDPERRWAWREVGPAQLAGEFDLVPEGGSTAPDNIPQMRQDAQMKMQMLAMSQGMLDPRKIMVDVLRDMGYVHPEAYLSSMQQLPPQTLDFIKQGLVDELDLLDDEQAQEFLTEKVEQAMQAAEQEAQAPGATQLPQEGPMAA